MVESRTQRWIDLHNPATNEVISRVPESTADEMNAAVQAAVGAFPSWSKTSVITRQQVMLSLQNLIKKHQSDIAKCITREQGKTLADAAGDVLRGLQVVEHACGIPSLLLGETLGSLATDLDSYSYRIPLGVCAGITPFNFPAMIPLWMFPMAIACGNTFVLKPSERDPGASMLLAHLAKEAGVPKGVLNVIHGRCVCAPRSRRRQRHGRHPTPCTRRPLTRALAPVRSVDAVNFICDNPHIKAISFVGSDRAGKHIYERGSRNGKRVQSNMGAKNHGVIT